MQFSSLLFAGGLDDMTSFSSMSYLVIFLPVCLVLYALMPARAKKYFLLVASFAFYWLVSGTLIIYLILSIFSVHYFGLWLDRINAEKKAALAGCEREQKKEIKAKFQRKGRLALFLAAFAHIGTLLVLKYSPFFTFNINSLFSLIGISFRFEIPSFLQPIGISFFSLQAFSYIFDVYRGTIKADTNIWRLGLFMSFFPQIVEGPICSYDQTAEKLWNVSQIKFENLTSGLVRIAFGLMKKVVIADRLDPLIKAVFKAPESYAGGLIAFTVLMYTVQLYMDFSGAMDAVMGTAQIFGVEMPENFRRPFFSKTISEFWQRWHITLGTWFKDYIFYPVTMSKPMKKLTSSARKKLGNHFGPLLAGSIALFCVWFCNGLWHGSAWHYIFFGMYHFVLILCGSLIAPAVKLFNEKLHINPERLPYRIFQILRSAVLVVFGELFFRANGLRAAFEMTKLMFTKVHFTALSDSTLKPFGIDTKDLFIVGVVVLIVFIVGLLKEKGIDVNERIASQNVVVRRIILYALIMFIIIFGAYGPGYVPVDPMYAEF